MRVRRMWLTVTIVACVVAGGALPTWAATAVDDPNLFGPGEAWPMPAAIHPGDSGPWIVRLQERLTAAGFRPGTPDGRYGAATLGAVYAFQKVHGLERSGVFTTDDWPLLDVSVTLGPSPDPDRVEVDLDRQVLFLVRGERVQAILPISSGNGDAYRGSAGHLVRAVTPEGDYTFYRHVDGWRISYLGGLYRPFYFRGGYAIHGSSSVPPYPASHGCVRVELHDMDYLATRLEIGMPIYVYGRRLSRDDVIPTTVDAAPDADPGPWSPVDSPVGPARI